MLKFARLLKPFSFGFGLEKTVMTKRKNWFCQDWIEYDSLQFGVMLWNYLSSSCIGSQNSNQSYSTQRKSDERTDGDTIHHSPLTGREFWNHPSLGEVPPPLHSQTAAHGTPPHGAVERLHQAAKPRSDISCPVALFGAKIKSDKIQKVSIIGGPFSDKRTGIEPLTLHTWAVNNFMFATQRPR
jgi:hypothetical protein